MQTFIIKGEESYFPITLQIEINKRIWRDKDFNIITEYNPDKFNILDCELCYYFISQNIKQTESRLTYDFKCENKNVIEYNDGSPDLYWDEFVSTLPESILENIMNTPIAEKIYISYYCPSLDWQEIVNKTPENYLEIYKHVDGNEKYLFYKENKISIYPKDFSNNPLNKPYIRYINLNETFLKDYDMSDIEYEIIKDRKFYKVLNIGWDR